MTELCARGRAIPSLLHWLSAALFLIAIVWPAAAAGPIVVLLDQARILQLPDRAATVVIGNPLIADLSIQPGGLAVITGKGYGATNFIVMDRGGAVLLEKTVEVQGPNDKIVVVYRGVDRETYSCTPICSPRITLGDDSDYFTKVLTEASTRNAQASGAGAMAAGH
ncbi:MAG: pilus assembly protein N-terminal domain-containing protein [Xanthobacteraceae bacterium]|jgi:hypothetical protein